MEPVASGPRGVFCLLDDQRWAPGADPWLRQHDAVWLRERFPLPRESGASGVVWIRRIEAKWLVCHACIPEFSRIRSTPSWTIATVPERAFRESAVLDAVIRDVRSSTGAPESWAGTVSKWYPEPWDPLAVAKLAELTDEAVREGPSVRRAKFVHSDVWLDRAGMLALQQVLVAMEESGTDPPAAVIVGEPGWMLPDDSIPPGGIYEFRSDAPSGAGVSEQPIARGVEATTFIDSFAACSELLRQLRDVHRSAARPPESFAEAIIPCVPLALVDPANLSDDEWSRWASAVAAASGSEDELARVVDGFVRRVERGETGIVSPILRLGAACFDRFCSAGSREDFVRADRILEELMGRVVRSP